MTVRPLEIDPLVAPPDVDMVLPGSKSITNRALVAAALAQGTSVLSNALIAEDTRAMVDCLGALGAEIDIATSEGTLTVRGTGGRLNEGAELWVRQSGTTARFVMPLAALASGGATVDGDPQIRSRPQAPLLDALEDVGARPEVLEQPGQLPVRLSGAAPVGGEVTVRGDVSSQFLSGLLLSAPLMAKGLVVELAGTVVSIPYVDMTVHIMGLFGAEVRVTDGRVFEVLPTGYQPCDLLVEPDASTASYFFAAAAISKGRVAVPGLGAGSFQGDLAFVDVLAQMGAEVTKSESRTEVRGPDELRGIEVSMTNISDTAPTLAAIAPFASGPVRATGIGFARAKESDRIAGPVAELTRLGIDAVDEGDGFVVSPGVPQAGVVETYDDHRMAMAFSVLGLRTPGVRIADPYCVAKTFPVFFDALDALRAAGDAQLAVLALDGPAGSGKSTVAKLAAKRLGLQYLDTGAMYRSVTWAALEAGLELADQPLVGHLARGLEIDVGLETVLVGEHDVTAAIRSEAVTANVSEVAANPGVRAAMRRQQRAWARRRGGGVLEGRDIGTVVFPSARLKVYVTASLEERARRRAGESNVPFADLVDALGLRDQKDSSREDSPLTEADNAVVLDTTGMSIEDVVERVVRLFGD